MMISEQRLEFSEEQSHGHVQGKAFLADRTQAQRPYSGKGFIKWNAKEGRVGPSGVVPQRNYSKVSKDEL